MQLLPAVPHQVGLLEAAAPLPSQPGGRGAMPGPESAEPEAEETAAAAAVSRQARPQKKKQKQRQKPVPSKRASGALQLGNHDTIELTFDWRVVAGVAAIVLVPLLLYKVDSPIGLVTLSAPPSPAAAAFPLRALQAPAETAGDVARLAEKRCSPPRPVQVAKPSASLLEVLFSAPHLVAAWLGGRAASWLRTAAPPLLCAAAVLVGLWKLVLRPPIRTFSPTAPCSWPAGERGRLRLLQIRCWAGGDRGLVETSAGSRACGGVQRIDSEPEAEARFEALVAAIAALKPDVVAARSVWEPHCAQRQSARPWGRLPAGMSAVLLTVSDLRQRALPAPPARPAAGRGPRDVRHLAPWLGRDSRWALPVGHARRRLLPFARAAASINRFWGAAVDEDLNRQRGSLTGFAAGSPSRLTVRDPQHDSCSAFSTLARAHDPRGCCCLQACSGTRVCGTPPSAAVGSRGQSTARASHSGSASRR